MSDLPPELPSETLESYQRYLGLNLASRTMLKNRIKNYLESLSFASGENEFLDLELAHKIRRSLEQLIEACADEQLPHVQAAVSYFIESDDATPDLGSVLGFEDDAEVVNAVCSFTGHPTLKVSF